MSEATVWPEQEAVDRWWRDVSQALKKAVTTPRLAVERRVTKALELLEGLDKELAQVSYADEKLIRAVRDDLTHIIAILKCIVEV